MDDSSQQIVLSTQSSIHHNQIPPEKLHSELKTDGIEEVVVDAANWIGPDKTEFGPAITKVGLNEGSQGAFRDIPDSGLMSCGLNGATGSTKPMDTSIFTLHAMHGPGFAIDHLTGISTVSQDRAEVQSVNAKEDQGHCVVSICQTSLPRRTSSSIRLSMSVDGKAEVVTDKEPTSLLTDLNLKPRSRGILQRSQSAVEPNDLSLGSRRGCITGRSRDARTWEFYCDSDTRNALTEHAEREQSGSAVGPIGLIRSKAIGQNTHKRNANPSKREPTKRQKSHDPLVEKPKLARTMSSVARLQSVKNIQKQDVKGKDRVPAAVLYEDGLDSDKENWEPGTQTSSERQPQRLGNPQIRRRLLEESRNHPSLSSSLGTLMNHENVSPHHSRPNTSSSHIANIPKTDTEVAEFMRERPAEMPEDLDCVQNLLSLSQAAWSRAA